MKYLALGAALMLALLPAAGRIFGSEAGHAAHAMEAGVPELHRAHDTAPGRDRTPEPAGFAGVDCGYCPLLAALVPPPRRLPVLVPAAQGREIGRAHV